MLETLKKSEGEKGYGQMKPAASQHKSELKTTQRIYGLTIIIIIIQATTKGRVNRCRRAE